jgi:GT2 family glycosyltransferase
MKLSVIIVNYNVEYFLEQCLNSVYKALEKVEGEVFVVDNNSIDGSCAMVKAKFPKVILIENKINTGFSKANNQAIAVAKGEYVLLLNPDTVVEEDTFFKTVNFMDSHPNSGGLGVKMIDGKGHFLPESKRGLPTPSVAFYKIFGLSRLFPRSKKFSKYHLGYLDKDKTHEIEILSGAFMMMRKSVLDKIGYLDEAFFMYGEDIDMSYRIILGGYKNYYFPETRIIHYKGESTKKSSVNYVFVFYNAMIIFAKKHFSEKNAKTFSFLINFAIYLRAGAAIFSRFLKKSIVPLFDYASIVVGLFLITHFYSDFSEKIFEKDLLNIALPSYGALWLISVWLNGGYDKPIKLLSILKGIFIGTALLLMIYGLLPKEVQFSRVILLLGSVWVFISYLFWRGIFHFTKISGYSLSTNYNKRFAIIGHSDETKRVGELLKQTNNATDFIANVSPIAGEKNADQLGDIILLNDIIDIHKIDEIIFCARDNSAQQIIDLMSKTESRKVDFKIAQPESLYLIGSNSIDTQGDLYVLDINSITRTKNVRNKRLIDFFFSIFILLFSPILILIVKRKSGFFPNIFKVLFGRLSWVGYSFPNSSGLYKLPKIKKGVIKASSSLPLHQQNEDTLHKIDIIYAKDYKPLNDILLITKGVKKLGD